MEFSFIIPAHNAELTIESCLNSIRCQNFKKQIILVCDHITDQTLNIAKRFADIEIYKVDFRSAAATRNFGAKHAVGNYLVFVDSDVALASNWLEVMSRNLSIYDVVIGGHSSSREVFLNLSSFKPPENFTLIKKSLFFEINGYKESFKLSGGEDSDLLIRILKNKHRVFYEKVSFKHYENNSLKKILFEAYGNFKMNLFNLDVPICWFWLLRKISGIVFFVFIYKYFKNRYENSSNNR